MERETELGRYSFTPDNIVPQETLPGPELLSERMASLGWPLELQGTGITDYKNRILKIYYPAGDIFLSIAVTIHEIGHWRQNEIDSELNKRGLNLVEDDITDIPQNERDAYKRGWERLQRYAPDFLNGLDQAVQKNHTEGKLMNVSNYREIFEFMQSVSLQISEVLATVNEHGMSAVELDEARYNALKKSGIEARFKELDKMRTGELVDKDVMRELLIRLAAGVANE